MDRNAEIEALKRRAAENFANDFSLGALREFMVTPGWWRPEAVEVIEMAIAIAVQREAVQTPDFGLGL